MSISNTNVPCGKYSLKRNADDLKLAEGRSKKTFQGSFHRKRSEINNDSSLPSGKYDQNDRKSQSNKSEYTEKKRGKDENKYDDPHGITILKTGSKLSGVTPVMKCKPPSKPNTYSAHTKSNTPSLIPIHDKQPLPKKNRLEPPNFFPRTSISRKPVLLQEKPKNINSRNDENNIKFVNITTNTPCKPPVLVIDSPAQSLTASNPRRGTPHRVLDCRSPYKHSNEGDYLVALALQEEEDFQHGDSMVAARMQYEADELANRELAMRLDASATMRNRTEFENENEDEALAHLFMVASPSPVPTRRPFSICSPSTPTLISSPSYVRQFEDELFRSVGVRTPSPDVRSRFSHVHVSYSPETQFQAPRLSRPLQVRGLLSRSDRSEGQFSYENLLRLEDVNVGVDKDLLMVMPVFVYMGENLSEKQCSICIETFNRGDSLRRLSCFHCFHQHCIDPWLKKSKRCPLCNVDVTNVENKTTKL